MNRHWVYVEKPNEVVLEKKLFQRRKQSQMNYGKIIISYVLCFLRAKLDECVEL